MTKGSEYWKNIYLQSINGKADHEVFSVSKESDAEIWAQYDNGEAVSDEKNKENTLRLNALDDQEIKAKATLKIFYHYAMLGWRASYSVLLQKEYFGEEYFGFGFVCDKPKTVPEKSAQEIVDRVADILNDQPIYNDSDLAEILEVIRLHNQSINLDQFNRVNRPSVFTRFSHFISSCLKTESNLDAPQDVQLSDKLNQIIAIIDNELDRLHSTKRDSGNVFVKIHLIKPSDSKIMAFEALKKLIVDHYDQPDFRAKLAQWEMSYMGTSREQRNIIHSLFSKSHQTSTDCAFNEIKQLLVQDHSASEESQIEHRG